MLQRYGTYAVPLGLCLGLGRVPRARGQAPATPAAPAPVQFSARDVSQVLMCYSL